MQTYEFTLILADELDESEEALDRLYDSGCDDGSPAIVNGISFVAFHRVANGLEEAIRSAIDNVGAAGYRVARVETPEVETVNRLNRFLQGTSQG